MESKKRFVTLPDGDTLDVKKEVIITKDWKKFQWKIIISEWAEEYMKILESNKK